MNVVGISWCGRSYGPSISAPPWRLRSRLKTFSAALVLCLNLGIDPPDIVKTVPCAKLECWVDPESLPSNKALEGIGRSEPRFSRFSGTQIVADPPGDRHPAAIRDIESES
jgi:hypothetical protein